MNEQKIISICSRIRITPPGQRGSLLNELVREIDAGPGYTANAAKTVANLRNALEWPEVKDNPLAVATIARTLREMRGAETSS